MFDVSRWGLPVVETDARGNKWLCVYLVTSNDESTFYLAVLANDAGTGSAALPAACSLVAIPLPPAEVEANKKRREAEAAKKASGG